VEVGLYEWLAFPERGRLGQIPVAPCLKKQKPEGFTALRLSLATGDV